jgi:hypothetical protein
VLVARIFALSDDNVAKKLEAFKAASYRIA